MGNFGSRTSDGCDWLEISTIALDVSPKLTLSSSFIPLLPSFPFTQVRSISQPPGSFLPLLSQFISLGNFCASNLRGPGLTYHLKRGVPEEVKRFFLFLFSPLKHLSFQETNRSMQQRRGGLPSQVVPHLPGSESGRFPLGGSGAQLLILGYSSSFLICKMGHSFFPHRLLWD